MNRLEAQALALEKMAEHGLTSRGWRLAFNRRKSALGLCNYSKKTIFLSEVYVALNSHANVLNTILHEIAHALAGHHAGHGPYWQEVCRNIGARPERCNGEADLVMPEQKYRLAVKLPCGGLELTKITRDRRGNMADRQLRGRPDTKNKLIWVENKG